MLKDTLDRLIVEAVNEILIDNISIKQGDSYSADLKNRVIYIKKLEPNYKTYYLLKHELYHFRVFPKTNEMRERIIREAGRRVSAEFLEDWYLIKIVYNVVSNAIVNKYGIHYDVHKEAYFRGHNLCVEEEVSKKGESILLREYMSLLDSNIKIDRAVDYVVDIYKSIIV